MINRPAFVIIATLILLAAALLSSVRARRLLAEYERTSGNDLKRDEELEKSVRRWQWASHVFSLFCLTPVPVLAFTYIDQLIAYVYVSAGTVLMAVAATVLKRTLDIKLGKLFGGVTVLNQIALAVLGFLGALVACIACVFATEPTLRAELLKTITK